MKAEVRDVPGRVVVQIIDHANLDDMRNWRREGFLDGFGERVGTAWLFSRREALAIALAAAMGRSGLGFDAAFEAVKNPTPAIIAALAGHGSTLRFRPRRSVGALSSSINVLVDSAAIISEVSRRLDVAFEAEQIRPRRRLPFEPAAAAPRA